MLSSRKRLLKILRRSGGAEHAFGTAGFLQTHDLEFMRDRQGNLCAILGPLGPRRDERQRLILPAKTCG